VETFQAMVDNAKEQKRYSGLNDCLQEIDEWNMDFGSV